MSGKLFITIEGVDGSGKSTIVSMLSDKLGATAIESPMGLYRKYRWIVEDRHPTIRFIYYLLANIFNSFKIKKLLKKDHIVCGRFIHSTKAHHMIYGCTLARIIPISFLFLLSKKPSATYYLSVDTPEREKRISNRNNNKKDLDSQSLEKVHTAFKGMPGMIEIDTTSISQEDVANIILKDISSRFGR